MSYMKFIVVAIVFFGIGLFAGIKHLAPALTQHHYTEKIIETKVEGEAKTSTETQIAYIPKETVIVKYIDPSSGQEAAQNQFEKTDIDAQLGIQEINVRLNGQEVAFQKSDDEQFVFEKNKIVLTQKSEINFDVRVAPPVVDKTRHWSVGIGYGGNGLAGKIDIPIRKNERVGVWIYGDKKARSVGVGVAF